MVPERTKKSSQHAWQELSPKLRDAVWQVCHDPLPGAVTRRALAAVERGLGEYSRRPPPRVFDWTAPVIAASILLIGVATGYLTVRTSRAALAAFPQPAPPRGVTAASYDDLRTVGAFAQAARQSPATFDALLDPQSRRPGPAKSPSVVTAGVAPIRPARGAQP